MFVAYTGMTKNRNMMILGQSPWSMATCMCLEWQSVLLGNG